MTRDTVLEVIRDFFERSFPDARLADDDDVFAQGFTNSLFAMQLVEFIESRFGIALEDEDLDIDNFRTLSAIGALVLGKLTATSGAGAALEG